MKYLSALIIGAIFGIGISFGGMANPAKVMNFFDLAGTWDASLIFVMAGALLVTASGYWLILRTRKRPLQNDAFQIPASRIIDARLIGGSAVFGIGWGISGFCPGGTVPALGLGNIEAPVFMIALVSGMLIARTMIRRPEFFGLPRRAG